MVRTETSHVEEYRVHAQWPKRTFQHAPEEDRYIAAARAAIDQIGQAVNLRLHQGYNRWNGHFDSPRYSTNLARTQRTAELFREKGFENVWVEQRIITYAKFTFE
jgi:hypothetical protein